MGKETIWRYQPLTLTRTHTDILNDQGEKIGAIQLETQGYTKENPKKGLFKSAKLLMKRFDLTVQNIDQTIEIKSSAHYKYTSFGDEVVGRTFQYTRDGQVETFELHYHNEATKFYYDFTYKNQTHTITFDHDGTHLEVKREDQIVAKWTRKSLHEYKLELVDELVEDTWLWFGILQHVRHHFPVSNLVLIWD